MKFRKTESGRGIQILYRNQWRRVEWNENNFWFHYQFNGRSYSKTVWFLPDIEELQKLKKEVEAISSATATQGPTLKGLGI